jgi:hypothetical protein
MTTIQTTIIRALANEIEANSVMLDMPTVVDPDGICERLSALSDATMHLKPQNLNDVSVLIALLIGETGKAREQHEDCAPLKDVMRIAEAVQTYLEKTEKAGLDSYLMDALTGYRNHVLKPRGQAVSAPSQAVQH